MYKGYIYKISHNQSGKENHYLPDKCYIGQTYQDVEARWRQHKSEAIKYDPTANIRPSKAAKLYEAMRVLGVENMKIECLEEVEYQNEQDLINELDRLEASYINQCNSIESGWNKVKAPQRRTARGDKTNLAEMARNFGVPYTSLLHRVNQLQEKPEDAVNHLKGLTSTVYIYKRQTYQDIRAVADSQTAKSAGLGRKTIEQRIRNARKSGRLQIEKSETDLLLMVYLDDEVFMPMRQKESLRLLLPDGLEIVGTIQSIFDELQSINAAEKYCLPVPNKYTTVQARLSRQSKKWTVQQAFGLDIPPSFNSVKYLIDVRGYRWAPDRPISDEGKPIVVHSTKEIFISHDAFCDEFPLSKYQVSDRILEGMDGDEILEHYGLASSVNKSM